MVSPTVLPPVGITIFWPIFNLVGFKPGFAAISALRDTPVFLAILAGLSPLATVYSPPPSGAVGVGGVAGGRAAGGATGIVTGGFTGPMAVPGLVPGITGG